MALFDEILGQQNPQGDRYFHGLNQASQWRPTIISKQHLDAYAAAYPDAFRNVAPQFIHEHHVKYRNRPSNAIWWCALGFLIACAFVVPT
jgi:hypothetical protein